MHVPEKRLATQVQMLKEDLTGQIKRRSALGESRRMFKNGCEIKLKKELR